MTSKQAHLAILGKSATKRRVAAKKPKMADTADRHVYYERSVQDTEAEFEFVDENFRRIRGRHPVSLREDFCGTANMCCEWVRQRRNNIAIGVDLDPDVQAWGVEHHITKLTPAQKKRVTLVNGNVLTVKTPPVDTILAMNFSYSVFKERAMLRRYFKRVRACLNDDGVFFMDAFGGYDAFREMSERTEHDGFSYIWDQHRYDPVTGEILCYIHFAFPDGSKLKQAFTYDWRLWTLPELQEILTEAGFRNVTVYWQGTDEKTGEGNGEFSPARHGEADAGWIAFLSAEK